MPCLGLMWAGASGPCTAAEPSGHPGQHCAALLPDSAAPPEQHAQHAQRSGAMPGLGRHVLPAWPPGPRCRAALRGRRPQQRVAVVPRAAQRGGVARAVLRGCEQQHEGGLVERAVGGRVRLQSRAGGRGRGRVLSRVASMGERNVYRGPPQVPRGICAAVLYRSAWCSGCGAGPLLAASLRSTDYTPAGSLPHCGPCAPTHPPADSALRWAGPGELAPRPGGP